MWIDKADKTVEQRKVFWKYGQELHICFEWDQGLPICADGLVNAQSRACRNVSWTVKPVPISFILKRLQQP